MYSNYSSTSASGQTSPCTSSSTLALDGTNQPTHSNRPSSLGPRFELLDYSRTRTTNNTQSVTHSLKTAPVITGDAFDAAGDVVFPQCALYGQVISQHSSGFPVEVENPALFVNANAPFSTLLCGVQGSGKSHSTSVLLESCLIRDDRLGTLPAPLAAIVFHFDTAAGGGAVQPCEAAYIGSLNPLHKGSAQAPPVTVLVLPTSLAAMKRVYSGLPLVKVEPLHFAGDDISAARLLSMMKVDAANDHMPLYMEAILNILRSLDSESFSYVDFRRELKEQEFNKSQSMMLNLRLSLLDSCLEGGNNRNKVANHFNEGHLTIVDLSSPFMDASSACGFFDLILGLFIETRRVNTGKLVVLDEAHKYLSDTGSSAKLTESLLGIIRQQRHLNMRVIVSTQEPTVVPVKFLDLCSFVIAHRFSSPSWLKHLVGHISTDEQTRTEISHKITSLDTGESLMFAPAGVSVRAHKFVFEDEDTATRMSRIGPLGAGYLLAKSRLRITQDGGHSILAVADPNFASRLTSNVIHSQQLESTAALATLPIMSSNPNELQVVQLHALHSMPTSVPLSNPIVTPTHPSTAPTHSLSQPDLKISTSISIPSKPSQAASTTAASRPPVTSTPSSQTPLPQSLKGQPIADEFKPLLRVLPDITKMMHRDHLGDQLLLCSPCPYKPGKGAMTEYLKRAEAAGLVSFNGDYIRRAPFKTPDANSSVSISVPTASMKSIASTSSSSSTIMQSPAAVQVSAMKPVRPVAKEFRPLLEVLPTSNKEGMHLSQVGESLRKRRPVPYTGKLKIYLERARTAGLVVITGERVKRI